MTSLRFNLHPQLYALTRLPADSPLPDWPRGAFVSVSRTPREITIACEQTAVPAGIESRGGFQCLEIKGEYPLDAVGVVAAATTPLAQAGISVFAFSVWSTDYLLIPREDLTTAVTALRGAGHAID